MLRIFYYESLRVRQLYYCCRIVKILWSRTKKKITLALPAEWALQKAFGPVLTELGDDLRRLYAVGRDKILAAAYKKIENIEDGKQANLRVARDVLWNGAFSDDDICAEYFGGILAASRSEDGKSDDSIQFSDVIKSLSSKQLHLHYVIYNCLNKLWIGSEKPLNVAQGAEVERQSVWFSQIELVNNLKLLIDTDLNILHKEGLLHSYKINYHVVGNKSLPYASVNSTTFGVLLYACAHNHLHNWRKMDCKDFGDFDGIKLPQFYASSITELGAMTGITPVDPTESLS